MPETCICIECGDPVPPLTHCAACGALDEDDNEDG